MSEEKTAYEGFAEVYDLFMEEIPYQQWLDFVTELLQKDGICDGLVLELGCGTGTFTELLAETGYDMIGVDSSAEMLDEAIEKKADSGHDILYLLQDMREFELYGTVRAVVSVCDSMNYLEDTAQLQRVCELVNNYLDPGGLFVFDLKTAHYFRTVCADRVMAENREEGSFIWENTWYEEEQVNEYDLTLYIRESSGSYRREMETHTQKAFSLQEVQAALAAAGMIFLAAYDADTKGAVTETTERMVIAARESGK